MGRERRSNNGTRRDAGPDGGFWSRIALCQSQKVNGTLPVRPSAEATGVGETRREIVRRECLEATSLSVGVGTHQVSLRSGY